MGKTYYWMNLGIFTICYDGYGEFAVQWCTYISQSTVMPAQVTLALFGNNHGLSDEIRAECVEVLPHLNIVHCGEHVSIGADRNKAIEETQTTWVMLLDVDDALLPGGLEEIEKCADIDIDVIAVAYVEEKLDGGTKMHLPPRIITDENLFLWRTNWISPYSPFRRFLWERTPYVDGEFPNAPMVFSFARNQARWARTDVLCARHIRRKNTHSTRRSAEEEIRVEGIIDDYAQPELGDINPDMLALTQIKKQRLLNDYA